MAFCSLVFFSLIGVLKAEDFRTWTIITGGHFEAKLNAVGTTMVTLENRDGKVIDFPLVDLKPSDQTYAREWASQQAVPASQQAVPPASSAIKVERSDFAKKVYKNLVYSKRKRLVRFAPEPADDPKYFAFYRSASWCPPCRAFTPQLVKFYKKQKRRDAAFELIFISSDKNEDAMAQYMDSYDMPWPAFEFGKNKNIVSRNGSGIPNLTVTDAKGKKLLGSYSDSGKYIGPTSVMEELEKLLR